MKAHAHRIEELRRGRNQAHLDASVEELFRRCPALCGFAVRDQGEGEFFISDLSVYPFAGYEARVALSNDIAQALSEFVDGHPEASALLRERTFARTFH